MKLHLPSGLRKALLACLAAVALPAATIPTTLASASGIAAVFLIASQRATADESWSAPETWPQDSSWASKGYGSSESLSLSADTVVTLSESDTTVSDWRGTQDYVFKLGEGAYEIDLKITGGGYLDDGTAQHSEAAHRLDLDGAFDSVWLAANGRYVIDSYNHEGKFNKGIKDFYISGSAQIWFNTTLETLTTNFHIGKVEYGDGWHGSSFLTGASMVIGTTLTTTGKLVLDADGIIGIDNNSSAQTVTFNSIEGSHKLTVDCYKSGNKSTLFIKEGGTLGALATEEDVTIEVGTGKTLTISGGLSTSATGGITLKGGTFAVASAASVEGSLTLAESTNLTLSGGGTVDGAFVFGSADASNTSKTFSLNLGNSFVAKLGLSGGKYDNGTPRNGTIYTILSSAQQAIDFTICEAESATEVILWGGLTMGSSGNKINLVKKGSHHQSISQGEVKIYGDVKVEEGVLRFTTSDDAHIYGSLSGAGQLYIVDAKVTVEGSDNDIGGIRFCNDNKDNVLTLKDDIAVGQINFCGYANATTDADSGKGTIKREGTITDKTLYVLMSGVDDSNSLSDFYAQYKTSSGLTLGTGIGIGVKVGTSATKTIKGGGAVTEAFKVTGGGTLKLAGTETYDFQGGLTLAAGVLELAADTTGGLNLKVKGDWTLSEGTTLKITGTNSLTIDLTEATKLTGTSITLALSSEFLSSLGDVTEYDLFNLGSSSSISDLASHFTVQGVAGYQNLQLGNDGKLTWSKVEQNTLTWYTAGNNTTWSASGTGWGEDGNTAWNNDGSGEAIFADAPGEEVTVSGEVKAASVEVKGNGQSWGLKATTGNSLTVSGTLTVGDNTKLAISGESGVAVKGGVSLGESASVVVKEDSKLSTGAAWTFGSDSGVQLESNATLAYTFSDSANFLSLVKALSTADSATGAMLELTGADDTSINLSETATLQTGLKKTKGAIKWSVSGEYTLTINGKIDVDSLTWSGGGSSAANLKLLQGGRVNGDLKLDNYGTLYLGDDLIVKGSISSGESATEDAYPEGEGKDVYLLAERSGTMNWSSFWGIYNGNVTLRNNLGIGKAGAEELIISDSATFSANFKVAEGTVTFQGETALGGKALVLSDSTKVDFQGGVTGSLTDLTLGENAELILHSDMVFSGTLKGKGKVKNGNAAAAAAAVALASADDNTVYTLWDNASTTSISVADLNGRFGSVQGDDVGYGVNMTTKDLTITATEGGTFNLAFKVEGEEPGEQDNPPTPRTLTFTASAGKTVTFSKGLTGSANVTFNAGDQDSPATYEITDAVNLTNTLAAYGNNHLANSGVLKLHKGGNVGALNASWGADIYLGADLTVKELIADRDTETTAHFHLIDENQAANLVLNVDGDGSSDIAHWDYTFEETNGKKVGFKKTGTGTLNFQTAKTIATNVEIAAGEINFSGGTAGISGALSGSGTLKVSSGTTTLSGGGTFSGTLDLTSGTLAVSTKALEVGTFKATTGALDVQSNLTIDKIADGSTTTLSSLKLGTSKTLEVKAGNFTIAGANSWGWESGAQLTLGKGVKITLGQDFSFADGVSGSNQLTINLTTDYLSGLKNGEADFFGYNDVSWAAAWKDYFTFNVTDDAQQTYKGLKLDENGKLAWDTAEPGTVHNDFTGLDYTDNTTQITNSDSPETTITGLTGSQKFHVTPDGKSPAFGFADTESNGNLWIEYTQNSSTISGLGSAKIGAKTIVLSSTGDVQVQFWNDHEHSSTDVKALDGVTDLYVEKSVHLTYTGGSEGIVSGTKFHLYTGDYIDENNLGWDDISGSTNYSLSLNNKNLTIGELIAGSRDANANSGARIGVAGTSTLTVEKVSGTNLKFWGNGTLVLTSGGTLSGKFAVQKGNSNAGNLTVSTGTLKVTGGFSGDALASLTLGANAGVDFQAGTLKATSLTLSGEGASIKLKAALANGAQLDIGGITLNGNKLTIQVDGWDAVSADGYQLFAENSLFASSLWSAIKEGGGWKSYFIFKDGEGQELNDVELTSEGKLVLREEPTPGMDLWWGKGEDLGTSLTLGTSGEQKWGSATGSSEGATWAEGTEPSVSLEMEENPEGGVTVTVGDNATMTNLSTTGGATYNLTATGEKTATVKGELSVGTGTTLSVGSNVTLDVQGTYTGDGTLQLAGGKVSFGKDVTTVGKVDLGSGATSEVTLKRNLEVNSLVGDHWDSNGSLTIKNAARTSDTPLTFTVSSENTNGNNFWSAFTLGDSSARIDLIKTGTGMQSLGNGKVEIFGDVTVNSGILRITGASSDSIIHGKLSGEGELRLAANTIITLEGKDGDAGSIGTLDIFTSTGQNPTLYLAGDLTFKKVVSNGESTGKGTLALHRASGEQGVENAPTVVYLLWDSSNNDATLDWNSYKNKYEGDKVTFGSDTGYGKVGDNELQISGAASIEQNFKVKGGTMTFTGAATLTAGKEIVVGDSATLNFSGGIAEESGTLTSLRLGSGASMGLGSGTLAATALTLGGNATLTLSDGAKLDLGSIAGASGVASWKLTIDISGITFDGAGKYELFTRTKTDFTDLLTQHLEFTGSVEGRKEVTLNSDGTLSIDRSELSWSGTGSLTWDTETEQWTKGGDSNQKFANGDSVTLSNTGNDTVQVTLSAPQDSYKINPSKLTIKQGKFNIRTKERNDFYANELEVETDTELTFSQETATDSKLDIGKTTVSGKLIVDRVGSENNYNKLGDVTVNGNGQLIVKSAGGWKETTVTGEGTLVLDMDADRRGDLLTTFVSGAEGKNLHELVLSGGLAFETISVTGGFREALANLEVLTVEKGSSFALNFIPNDKQYGKLTLRIAGNGCGDETSQENNKNAAFSFNNYNDTAFTEGTLDFNWDIELTDDATVEIGRKGEAPKKADGGWRKTIYVQGQWNAAGHTLTKIGHAMLEFCGSFTTAENSYGKIDLKEGGLRLNYDSKDELKNYGLVVDGAAVLEIGGANATYDIASLSGTIGESGVGFMNGATADTTTLRLNGYGSGLAEEKKEDWNKASVTGSTAMNGVNWEMNWSEGEQELAGSFTTGNIAVNNGTFITGANVKVGEGKKISVNGKTSTYSWKWQDATLADVLLSGDGTLRYAGEAKAAPSEDTLGANLTHTIETLTIDGANDSEGGKLEWSSTGMNEVYHIEELTGKGKLTVADVTRTGAQEFSRVRIDKITVGASDKLSLAAKMGEGTSMPSFLLLGSVDVADGGTLDVNVEGRLGALVNIAGGAFKKTGAGTLTLNALRVSDGGTIVMTHEGTASITKLTVDSGGILTYEKANKENIFTWDWNTQFESGFTGEDFTKSTWGLVFKGFDAEELKDEGIWLGIQVSDSDSLSDVSALKDHFTVEGIDGFTLEWKSEGGKQKLYLTATNVHTATDFDWDANWGTEELGNAPTEEQLQSSAYKEAQSGDSFEANALVLTGDKTYDGVTSRRVSVVGGGGANAAVIGGKLILSNHEGADDLDSNGKVYIYMKPENDGVENMHYHLLVGGSSLLKSGVNGTASFVGSTHIQVEGGTVDYIIGGNHVNNSALRFEGHTYISVMEGAKVAGGIVGGSTLTYGTNTGAFETFVGDSHIFIYTPLGTEEGGAPGIQDGKEAEAKGFAAVVGGNAWIDLPETAPEGGMKPTFHGNSAITIDLSEVTEHGNFEKAVVGGNYAVVTDATGTSDKRGTNFEGDTTITITAGDTDVFTRGINGGTRRAAVGGGETTFKGSATIDITGGTYQDAIAGGFWFEKTEGAAAAGARQANFEGGTAVMLNGGNFWRVAGGSYSLSGGAGSHETYTADSSVTIKGGVFKNKGTETDEMGFIAGGNFYSGSLGTYERAAAGGEGGNTSVTISGGTVGETGGQGTMHVVGGDYVNFLGGEAENQPSASIEGTSSVTVDGPDATRVNGILIAGSYMTDAGQYGKVTTGGTSLSVKGGRIDAGSDHATHKGTALVGGHVLDDEGSSGQTGGHTLEVTGKTTLSLTGGTIHGDVVGGSYVYNTGAVGTVSNEVTTGSVELTIAGSTISGDVYGGHYAASTQHADKLVVGNVSITMTSGEVTGNIVGGSYHSSLDGGSGSANGAVSIALTGGTLDGDVYAAGYHANAEAKSVSKATESVAVEVGKDFVFAKADATVSGGYYKAAGAEDSSTVTNGSTLRFTDASGYTGPDGVSFIDFSTVETAGEVSLAKGLGVMADSLTKSGEGTLTLTEGLKGNGGQGSYEGKIVLDGGSLKLGAAQSLKGGLEINLNGRVENDAESAWLAGTERGLTLDGASCALTLTGVADWDAQVGTYYLASGLTEGITLESFTGYNDALGELKAKMDTEKYIVRLQVTTEGNLTLTIAELDPDHVVWTGGAEGDDASTWTGNKTDNFNQNELAGDQKDPDNHVVWFTQMGEANSNVAVDGPVTPAGVVVQDGDYVFAEKDGSGSVNVDGGEASRIGDDEHDYVGKIVVGDGVKEASLDLQVATTTTAGIEVKNMGTLTLTHEKAIDSGTNVTLEDGAKLAYGEKGGKLAFTEDISERISGEGALNIAIGNASAEEGSTTSPGTITWGDASKAATDGVTRALDDGVTKSGAGEFELAWSDADGAEKHDGDITVEDGALGLNVGGSTEMSGNVTGAGTLKVNGGEVTLSGENDVKNIEVAKGATLKGATSGALGTADTTITLQEGSALAGAGADGVAVNSTVDVKGSASMGGKMSLSGDLKAEGTDTVLTAEKGAELTVSGAGSLAGYKGSLSAEEDAQWTISDTVGETITTDMGGAGSYHFSSEASSLAEAKTTTLSGVISGEANVVKEGMGTLILTGENKATGELVAAGADSWIVLGSADGEKATWGGSTVGGSGRVVLQNVELAKGGFTTKTAEGQFGLYVDVSSGNEVNLNGMNVGEVLIDSVTIGEGGTGGKMSGMNGTMTVSEGATHMKLTFTDVNISTSETTTAKTREATVGGNEYLIGGSGSETTTLNVESADSFVMDFSNQGFFTILHNALVGGQESYLHILEDGKLDISDEALANLKYSLKSGNAQLLADLDAFKRVRVEDGNLVIAGELTNRDVYFVTDMTDEEGNPVGNSPYIGVADPPEGEAVGVETGGYGILGQKEATLLEGTKLHLTLTGNPNEYTVTPSPELGEEDPLWKALEKDKSVKGAYLHNLVGLPDSELQVENGKKPDEKDWVRVKLVLDNTSAAALDGRIEDSDEIKDVKGQDTQFDGTITAGEGVDVEKTGAGTLTVGGEDGSGGLTMTGEDDTLSIAGGALKLRGHQNELGNVELAYGNPTEGEEQGLILDGGKATVNGDLSDEGVTAKDAIGNIQVNRGGELKLKGKDNKLSQTDIIGDGSGTVTLDEGARLTLSGEEEDPQRLTGVGVNLADDSTLDVGMVGGEVTSLDGSGTLRSNGSTLTVGGGTFSGSLGSSQGFINDKDETLRVAAEAEFTLNNANNADDGDFWNVYLEDGATLNVDVSKKRGDGSDRLYLDNITLGDGSNMKVDFGDTAVNENALSGEITGIGVDAKLTFKSDAELKDGGVLLTGITVADSVVNELNLEEEGNLDKYVDLEGKYFEGVPGFLKDFRKTVERNDAGDWMITVTAETPEDNKFERTLPNMSKNAQAGATMMWNSLMEQSSDVAFLDALLDPDSDYKRMAYALVELSGGNNGGNVDKAGLEKALAAVAGSSTAVLAPAMAEDMHRQLTAIRNRTTTMGSEQRYDSYDVFPLVHAWLNAESAYRKLDADGFAPGYTLNSWGGTVGADMDVSPRTTVGLALTAMYGDLKTDAADVGKGDMDTAYVTGFVKTASGPWTHTFVVSGGLADITLNRTVSAGSASYTTKGDTEGYAVGALYELGYTKLLNKAGTLAIQPVVNVEVRHVGISGYTEKNSDAGLTVDDMDYTVVTLGAGARMQAVVGQNAWNRYSVLEGRLLVKGDLGDRSGEVNNALFGSRGTVESAEVGAVGIEAGIGLTIPLGSQAGSLFIDGSVELREHQTSFDANLGYRISF